MSGYYTLYRVFSSLFLKRNLPRVRINVRAQRQLKLKINVLLEIFLINRSFYIYVRFLSSALRRALRSHRLEYTRTRCAADVEK